MLLPQYIQFLLQKLNGLFGLDSVSEFLALFMDELKPFIDLEDKVVPVVLLDALFCIRSGLPTVC